MRAVIDTNILIRALIKPRGTVGPVLGHLAAARYVLIYSEPLLNELVDVLGRPRIRIKYHLTDGDVVTVLALITLRGEAVVPEQPITVCRDPKDNMLLEAAVAGRADALVTGDSDLLVLHPFEGIPIIGPADFLLMLEEGHQGAYAEEEDP